MKSGQYSAEQIIKILDQAQIGEKPVAAICRERGIAEATLKTVETAKEQEHTSKTTDCTFSGELVPLISPGFPLFLSM